MLKQLLISTSIIEAGAGIALLCSPSVAFVLLLNSPLDTSAGQVLGRVAGAALFALAIANWFAHYDLNGAATRGLVLAMIVYNLGAVFILGSAGLGSQSVGVALWPAVILHSIMTAWCVANLLRLEISI
jgi:hypothetical protein